MVVFSVLLENTGFLKAGPRPPSEFDPTSGPVYKFSDVHGVDEVKEVIILYNKLASSY